MFFYQPYVFFFTINIYIKLLGRLKGRNYTNETNLKETVIRPPLTLRKVKTKLTSELGKLSAPFIENNTKKDVIMDCPTSYLERLQCGTSIAEAIAHVKPRRLLSLQSLLRTPLNETLTCLSMIT